MNSRLQQRFDYLRANLRRLSEEEWQEMLRTGAELQRRADVAKTLQQALDLEDCGLEDWDGTE